MWEIEMLSSKMTPLRMRNDYDYLLSAHEIMQLDSLTFMVSIPQTDQNSPGSRFRISHIPNMRFSSETKTYLIYATFCNICMTNKKQNLAVQFMIRYYANACGKSSKKTAPNKTWPWNHCRQQLNSNFQLRLSVFNFVLLFVHWLKVTQTHSCGCSDG